MKPPATISILILILALTLLTACAGPPKGPAEQQPSVVGLVTNAETGFPVIGASAHLVLTNLGARTDTNGFFRIVNVPSGEYTLRFTSVEFLPKEIEVIVSATRPHSLCVALDRNPAYESDSNKVLGPVRMVP